MANRFWVGGNGNWSDDTNHWATSSGGAAGGGNKPGAGDTAIFDSSSGGGTATLDEAPSITALDMQTGNTTTLDTSGSNFAFTTSGNFTLTAGTFTANGSVIAVSGNFSATAGTFNAGSSALTVSGDFEILVAVTHNSGTSTVVLDGTGTLRVPAAADILNDISCAASGMTTTLDGEVHTRILRLGTGVITADAAARSLMIGDGAAAGQVFFNAGATIDDSGNNYPWFDLNSGDAVTNTFDGFNNGDGDITIKPGSGGATVQLLGAVTTTGTMTIEPNNNSAVIDFNDQTVTVGTLTTDTGAQTTSVLFGTGTVDIGSGGLTIAGAGVTFDFESATIQCAGDFTVTAGAIDADASTVVFDGSGTQTITSGGEALNNVTVTNVSAGGIDFDDAVNIAGALVANAGSANINLKFDQTASHVIADMTGLTGSGMNCVCLRSQVDDNQWDVSSSTTGTVDHVDVKDSNLSGVIITANDSIDSGNNSANWVFNGVLEPRRNRRESSQTKREIGIGIGL